MKQQRDVAYLAWKVLIVTMLVFCLFLIVFAVAMLEPKEHIRRDCMSAGYLDYEKIGRTNVCVGIRDGVYVMETVDDVRARLGE